jgi:hypothetical protein
MPSPGDGSLAPIEAIKQFGQVVDDPAADRCLVNGYVGLRHHLFQVSEAEIVGQIPPDTEQDHGAIETPTLEHATLRP